MKKTPSTHSLINSRRGSLQKLPFQQRQCTQKKNKQHKQQQNPIPKHRIPSPVVKNIKHFESFKEQSKHQQKKADIKQIYEYKIKQRANRSKISQRTTQKSKVLSTKLQQHQQTTNNNNSNNNQSPQIPQLEDKRLIESLKLQNEKMSRQLDQLVRQNKQLTQLLKQSMKFQQQQQQQDNNTKNSNETKKEHTNTKQKSINNNEKHYKKTILTKLNDPQRLKTQMTSSFTKLNSNNNACQQHQQRLISSKSKCSTSSKRKLSHQESGNNITMNLNMSFVKIKSPSVAKNHQFKNPQKQFINKIPKSNSNKNLHFKQSSSKSTSKLPTNSSQNSTDIKSLFKTYLQKKSITPKDLSEFYLLNKKIFKEFTTFISFSRKVYTQILNKIDISQCYDSKRLQQTQYSKNQSNMKETLRLIQQLYKMNSLHNSTKRDFESSQVSEKKYFISQIQFGDGQQTPDSSVVSFTEQAHHNNEERQKSYQKYRLKKLNENLDLFANMQSKKLKSQATQPQTTQSKVYLSKPISTSVSRKISFNNSFNS